MMAVWGSYKTGKLTLAGSLCGALIALSIYAGAGFTGITMLAAFFIMATFATSWKKQQKNNIYHPQKRNAAQVLANGSVAAFCGIMMILLPGNAALFAILMASTLASATSDTLSSELGIVYGVRFYNIITLKKDERGRDGVISMEGMLIGIGSAIIIALIYGAGFGFNSDIFIIVIAGTAGNIADSVLGATLERGGYLQNNMVNFLNTAIAALIGWLLIII
ncbi:DUF92 domain-containing protein [Mucilaginibacter sp. SD-g]|uniref:DUF92 domain-containing protein n=1 Tax=Mucilaginibacter segetis TaxID=2793071 RepID=A0A934UP57_9SPHI|nr:DUF92 domain-containing protein [Mucilaginibacter segetis]